MLADLPKVDGGKWIYRALAVVPESPVERSPRSWHELLEVDVAHVDSDGAQHPETKDRDKHNVDVVGEHEHVPADEVTDHAEPEQLLPTILVRESWHPEKCDAPASEEGGPEQTSFERDAHQVELLLPIDVTFIRIHIDLPINDPGILGANILSSTYISVLVRTNELAFIIWLLYVVT